jgi:hypothetical protein
VDEHIEVELAPEFEADQTGELKGRYGLEKDQERISWGRAMWIHQILSRMSSTTATHAFLRGRLIWANNAHEAFGHPKKTFWSGFESRLACAS